MRPLEPLPSHLPESEQVARLPRGFEAIGTTAGIKDSGKPDLAVVLVKDGPGAIAATFTTNRLPAAAVRMNQAHLRATAPEGDGRYGWVEAMTVSYTHLTLPTICFKCRSRWGADQ